MTKILAIETSCDETSVAISADNEVLANVVSSQIEIHKKWGGVVPNLAAREHIKNIIPVLEEAQEKAEVSLREIDVFAVTAGPGLIPALLVGVNIAKTLAYFYQKPLMGIHHIEGHIYANFIENKPEFPVLALVVSGGHTQLVLIRDHLEYEIIGQTQDDASGEAFDKVAKMLDLGYPGGPIVSKRADEYTGDLDEINFPRPMLNSGDFDFSFSGLKTAVLYHWQNNPDKKLIDSICYHFQEAAIEVLVKKTAKAIKKYNPKTVLLAGGVAANKKLREDLEKTIKKDFPKVNFGLPSIKLCLDNAAMIAAAAFFRYQKQKNDSKIVEKWQNNWRDLEADCNLELG